jgi:hypothetical protein
VKKKTTKSHEGVIRGTDKTKINKPKEVRKKNL